MTDVFSSTKRSEIMSRIGSINTKPEVRLRKALYCEGLRFRLHLKQLPGRPDIVIPKFQTVIQVRGCFWHGHECRDGHIPKTGQKYWKPKLLNNKRRDFRNDRALRQMGWSVITVWECKTENQETLTREVRRILRILYREKHRIPSAV